MPVPTEEMTLLTSPVSASNPTDPTGGLAALFRSRVRLVERRDEETGASPGVLVQRLSTFELEAAALTSALLPLLVIPAEWNLALPEEGVLTLVAAEGADKRLAVAVCALLDPVATGLAIVHATWLPGTVASPLPVEGLDNPEPSELLLYRGAVEALVETASTLREFGFSVSTHLREARDPAEALAGVIDEARPALVVLGLGKHGAGIGSRLLQEARVPILYVAAR